MKLFKQRMTCGLLVVLIALVGIPTISANLIVPNSENTVFFNYEIVNMDEYDDYVFILYGLIIGYHIIEPDESFDVYKFGQTWIYEFEQWWIYAVKSVDFNESEIENESMWKDYFESNPKFIKSDIQLNSIYDFVAKNNPLISAYIALEIVTLDENQLTIEKSKVIYTYTDGTTEEKYIISQDVLPQPSKTALLPYWFESLWYVWIPLFALIGISLILLLRKRIKEQ